MLGLLSKCVRSVIRHRVPQSELPLITSVRHDSSYYASRTEEEPEKYTKVEKSYAEWKYVEKLMPLKYVPPVPADPNQEFPSGWKAPNIPKDSKYIVRRNKNHMIPVYLVVRHQGNEFLTVIKRVEGNIWALEEDVGNYLQKKYPNKLLKTHVNESSQRVNINGNHYRDVFDWVAAKGF